MCIVVRIDSVLRFGGNERMEERVTQNDGLEKESGKRSESEEEKLKKKEVGRNERNEIRVQFPLGFQVMHSVSFHFSFTSMRNIISYISLAT